MTERDIQDLVLVLKNFANVCVQDEVPPRQKEQVFALVGAVADLTAQALIDLNRIANALEQIALNGHPRPL